MAALSTVRNALIGRSVAVPLELARRHPELSNVRIRRGGLPPRVGGWMLGNTTVAAITLWSTIWLAPSTPWSEALLLHELRHVHQFAASRLFPVRYIRESLRCGYHRNPYEVDARRFAAARVRTPGAHPPSEDV